MGSNPSIDLRNLAKIKYIVLQYPMDTPISDGLRDRQMVRGIAEVRCLKQDSLKCTERVYPMQRFEENALCLQEGFNSHMYLLIF